MSERIREVLIMASLFNLPFAVTIPVYYLAFSDR